MNTIQKNTRGGQRPGAGRPKGRNQHGEATHPVRIPISKIHAVKAFLAGQSSERGCPLFSSTVKAGFPSPAEDSIEQYLDLNTHLIQHPAATFFVIASGDSMRDAGIQSGDLLIVDRAIEPTHDKIVIAAIHGELTVKRLRKTLTEVQLIPAHPDYPVIEITEEMDLIIWGVVTHVIHTMSPSCML
jgi:DNA polymerase V